MNIHLTIYMHLFCGNYLILLFNDQLLLFPPYYLGGNLLHTILLFSVCLHQLGNTHSITDGGHGTQTGNAYLSIFD